MSAQPEALRLAEWLDNTPMDRRCLKTRGKASAELRRLHEVNTELLEALKQCRSEIWRLLDAKGVPPVEARAWPEIVMADDAIAKATEEQA